MLLDRHIRGEEVIPLLKPVDILGENFSREIDKLHSPRGKAMRMEHAVRHTIQVKIHEDPVFFEGLNERLERIIAERKASRLDDVAEFRLLGELAREMRERNEQAGKQGVAPEQLPFFNALQKAFLSSLEASDRLAENPEPDIPRLTKDIFEDLKVIAVIDWDKKEEIMRDMRRAIKRRLRMDYNIPSEAIEPLVASLMELARVHLPR